MVRDRDFPQPLAAFKAAIADGLQSIRHGDVFKSGATRESPVVQCPHTRRHDHLFEMAATMQGIAADALQPLGQNDRPQVAAVGQSIVKHIMRTAAAKQARSACTHDASALQFHVDVVVDRLFAAVNTARAVTYLLQELKVFGIHRSLDMQQAHTVEHVGWHLGLKGPGLTESDLDHIAIGVGAAITVTISLIATAAILCHGGQNGHDGQQYR